MDKFFHYHVVRELAKKAGFDDEKSQRIAVFSQFVDDYSTTMPLRYFKVPKFARHLTNSGQNTFRSYYFVPATTGFVSTVDSMLLLSPERQKNIVVPFHFIPNGQLSISSSNQAPEYHVQPAKIGDGSLISTMLTEAKDTFMAETDTRVQDIHLIRIGMLIHIFADTYAHQGFSGFNAKGNEKIVDSVACTCCGKPITDEHSMSLYSKLPPIGHGNVGHLPDMSNVSFGTKQKSGGEADSVVFRNNTTEYYKASVEILNYLRSCLGEAAVDENHENWFEFAYKLKDWLKNPSGRGLYDSCSHSVGYDVNCVLGVPVVAEASTSFDKVGVGDQTIYADRSDDYFRYNVIADDIRRQVYGEPRKIDKFMQSSSLA